MSGIVFVAGFVGYKLKAKVVCSDCRVELLTDKALICEYPKDHSFDYLSQIDRGRLTWPTELLVDVVVQSVVTFKCLLSDKYVTNFNTIKNQRSTLMHLAQSRCEKVLNLDILCVTCNTNIKDITKMCIRTIANISLNNYTKRLTDCKTNSKTLRKLSTLTK